MPPSASSRSTSSDDQAQNSSDDEYGVFLGAHDPFENQLVSKLSNSSPLHSTSRLRQKPVLIQKLRKRDSREFLRRKTLSSSAKDEPETNENVRSKGKERTWEGGFYEKMDRRGSESYSSTSDPPSPEVSGQLPVYSDDITTPSQWARISGHSDLTLDFSAFYLTETPPTSVSSVDTEHSDRESTLQGCAEGRKGVVSGEDEYTEDGPGNSEQEKGSLPMLLDMERSKEKARLIVDTDFKLELGARDPEENEADGADDVSE